MQKITSVAELKKEIALLEGQLIIQKQELKEHYAVAFESIKPVNILKHTLKDLTESPFVQGNLINTSMGLATGFLSKKLLIGSTMNPLKQLLGYALQTGVSAITAKNGDAIRETGLNLFRKLFKKKKDQDPIPEQA